VSTYRPKGVVFMGIGGRDFVNPGAVRGFAYEYGWDFPVAFDTKYVFGSYKTTSENFFVIGPDGKIKYRSANTASLPPWSVTEPQLKQAIEAALAMTGTVDLTWGRIKALYH